MQQKSNLQAQTSAGLLLQGGGGIGTTRIMSVQNPLVKLSSLRVTGENKSINKHMFLEFIFSFKGFCFA